MNEASKVKRDKYLIIKHGALGDILQGLDAFESLRTSFPSANLTLLTSPAFASLANLMPYFDSIIIDERKPFYYFRKTYQIRNHFRKNWTAVIDLQCSKEQRLILIGFINEVVVIGMELQRNAVTQCLISQM